MTAPTWNNIVSAYVALAKAARADQPIVGLWNDFAALVAKSGQAPPDHMRMMLRSLRQIQREREPEDIWILDHGCGSGLNAFYLVGLGYRNMFGVNVNDEVDHLNRIYREVFGVEDTRLVTTDGGHLPFDDGTFDFIVSNQVLEHVSDDKIDLYYAEEGRVLKPGGGVFHEAPHLLVPYDSHARVWFAHMLPRFLKPLAYGVLKSLEQRKFMFHTGLIYTKHYESFLFLRSRLYHRRQLIKHIGAYRDLTLERLLEPFDSENYDPDANPLYRILMDKFVRLPVIGRRLARFFAKFVIMQTITMREGEHRGH